MYTWEMKEYIDNRGHVLDGEEAIYIQNHREHPQITRVKAEGYLYRIWTNDGYMEFYCKPYVKVKKI